MPEGRAYLSAVSHAHGRTPGRTSIVNGSIAAAIEGKFGNVRFTDRTAQSELFINPLMAIYFAFDLPSLAKQSLYLHLLEDTESIFDVGARISAFRHTVEPRPRVPIPSLTMSDASDTVVLFRPVGEKELASIRASSYRAFPPRLPEQPIFYPVVGEDYAVQIARDWNTRDGGVGYVTRFRCDPRFCSGMRAEPGASMHEEYWIPAEDLPDFNAAMVGPIEVIAELRR